MPGTPHTRGRVPDWALNGLDIEGPADSNLNRAVVKRGSRPVTETMRAQATEQDVVDASEGAMQRLKGLRHDQREDVALVIARAQMESDQKIAEASRQATLEIAEMSHRTTVRVALLTFLGTVLAGAVGAAATIWVSRGAGP